jgi:hypothetical protein
MLRVTATHDVAFRKKEPFFSKNFAIALALALSIHIALVLVFRIVTLPNLDMLKPLTPTDIEIDLSCEKVEALPHFQVVYSPTERLNIPTHFCFEEPNLQPEPFAPKKIEITAANFAELEKIDYHRHPFQRVGNDQRR